MSSSLSTSSLFPLTQSQGTLESVAAGTATSSSCASIRNTKKPVDFPTNSQGEQQHVAAPTIELPENSRIIEPSYLSKHANKVSLALQRFINAVSMMNSISSVLVLVHSIRPKGHVSSRSHLSYLPSFRFIIELLKHLVHDYTLYM